MPEPSLNERRAEIARVTLAASRNPTDPTRLKIVRERKRDYAAAKLADYIQRVVDNAPPLTAEQRDRLSLLLRGGDAA